ncbi:MAG: DUF3775 domain-containing protein [Alphaproteobacteria bacterium]
MDEESEMELTISPEKVCNIIQKARVVMEKVEATDPDSGSNPTDDDSIDVLESLGEDASDEELAAVLNTLNYDEELEILALLWLGRGDFTADSWDEALDAARGVRHRHIYQYLSETPRAPDFLEEGLSQFGYSCNDTWAAPPSEIER